MVPAPSLAGDIRHGGRFALSLVAFNTGVQKQFFPPASRPEIMIDIWLPQGASLKATEREVKRVEALLDKDENIASWSSYIGNGAPRFFLSLDQQLLPTTSGRWSSLPGASRSASSEEPPRGGVRRGRRFLVASAAARGAPGKRAADRLPGAVPRSRRRPRGPARQRGRRCARNARPSQPAQREFQLERSRQVGQGRNRPGPRPGAGGFQPGRGPDPAGLADGGDRDPVPRERPVDRRRLARRRRERDRRRDGVRGSAQRCSACPIWTSFPPAAGTFRWPRWRAWCRCSRRA
jgi:hypothetical protein